MVKEAFDTSTGDSRVALAIYAGDFERRGLVSSGTSYDRMAGTDLDSVQTETQYVVAGARMVWQHGSTTSVGSDLDRNHRATIPVGDLLHTTAATVDLLSGELLEVSTYYPNGARETLLVDDELSPVPLEPMGFTGKEADEHVGLVYFGERYLIARLGRWASPDPLHVHASGGGEVLNSYHYVGGGNLQTRDPVGLCGRPGESACPGDESEGAGASAATTAAGAGRAPTDADRAIARQAAADLAAAREAQRQARVDARQTAASIRVAFISNRDRLPADAAWLETNAQDRVSRDGEEWVPTVTVDAARSTDANYAEAYRSTLETELASLREEARAIAQVEPWAEAYTTVAAVVSIALAARSGWQSLTRDTRAVEAVLRAERALDDAIAAMTRAERRTSATMVAAYDAETGAVAVGRSSPGRQIPAELAARFERAGVPIGTRRAEGHCAGDCAEVDTAIQLMEQGVPLENVRFTGAVRPRTSDDEIGTARQPLSMCSGCSAGFGEAPR